MKFLGIVKHVISNCPIIDHIQIILHYQKYFLKIFLKLECISCPIVSKYKLILRKYII